jgi:hypothetical protein
MRLQKVTSARSAVELTPGAPTEMAIGPQVAKPQPTVIITAVMRAKVLRGVNLTRSSVRRRHGVGPHRCPPVSSNGTDMQCTTYYIRVHYIRVLSGGPQ